MIFWVYFWPEWFLSPGYPNVIFFFSLHFLNEIKIYHSKNLFYGGGRIQSTHRIKMHSMFVFICQEVTNMQSTIYKNLSKTSLLQKTNIFENRFLPWNNRSSYQYFWQSFAGKSNSATDMKFAVWTRDFVTHHTKHQHVPTNFSDVENRLLTILDISQNFLSAIINQGKSMNYLSEKHTILSGDFF